MVKPDKTVTITKNELSSWIRELITDIIDRLTKISKDHERNIANALREVATTLETTPELASTCAKTLHNLANILDKKEVWDKIATINTLDKKE